MESRQTMNITYPVHWPKEQYRRGWDTSPRHSGVDYGWRAQPNTAKSKQNLAAAPGRVESVTDDGGNNQDWGNRIWVQHTGRAATTYNHAKTGSAKVRKGQIVDTGDVLSTMGATGAATGDHLHFELYIDGKRVDPQPYLDGKPLPGNPIVEQSGGKPAGGSTYAQRKVKNVPLGYINGRIEPDLGASVRQKLNEGVVGNFDAFIRGEQVSQNGVNSDIWFRGAFNHNWFWSGNFTSQSTAGMRDMGSFRTQSKPKKQYVRIPEPYIWYDHPDDAARAVDRHYSVPKGDYPLIRVDSRGPRLIQWGNRQVWVGSTKTRPAIITK